MCSKLDQTLKILEKKLEDHQATVQAMKDDLSLREEEAQVITALNFSYHIM